MMGRVEDRTSKSNILLKRDKFGPSFGKDRRKLALTGS
jgi:hypothetical protein